nr:hypothetical protein [Actinomycetota bacterium]
MRQISGINVRRLGTVVALTLVGSSITTGMSMGSIPAGDGTFSGCYGQRTEVVSLATPVRVLDTRNGTGGYTGAFANSSTHTISLPGAPAGALMVVGNVTVTGPIHSGFVTLWPSGSQPATSSLNYAAGQTVANGVQVAISAGTMQAFVSNATQLIFDVSGYVLPVSNVVHLIDSTQSCQAGETAAAWKQVPAFVAQFGAGNIPDGNQGSSGS